MKLDCVFDLDFSLCCGQVFRWQKIGGWWYGVVGGKPFKVRQIREELEFEGVSSDFVGQYFGLGDDLGQISKSVCKDATIAKALKQFEGLRIVRQNSWECLISFICATYKSIAAIENMLEKMGRKFGEKVCFDGLDFYSFPTVEKLAKANEQDLQACGLGYRAKYVRATAQKILESDVKLEDLKGLSYLDAKKVLLEFDGVGPKVADCVLLFSLDKLEAFPVDVWVKRVLLKYYSDNLPEALVLKMKKNESLSNSEYRCLNEFGRQYFGKYAGYAQEYLYHYERMQPKE